MSRQDFYVGDESGKQRLIGFIRKARPPFFVQARRNTRSNPQNAKMWAMLGDVSRQTDWHGQKLSPEDWKLLFMAGLNQELRVVPNLQGTGFVQLGRSSSKLTKEEMSDLIELIYMFAAERDLVMGDEVAA